MSDPQTEAKAPSDPEAALALERGFRVEHNRDGSTVIKLAHPVRMQVDGRPEDIDRLFIPALTGKHMRQAAWKLHEGATVGDLLDFAATVVEPLGCVDVLSAWIARNLAVEVMHALGKSRPGGAVSSPG